MGNRVRPSGKTLGIFPPNRTEQVCARSSAAITYLRSIAPPLARGCVRPRSPLPGSRRLYPTQRYGRPHPPRFAVLPSPGRRFAGSPPRASNAAVVAHAARDGLEAIRHWPASLPIHRPNRQAKVRDWPAGPTPGGPRKQALTFAPVASPTSQPEQVFPRYYQPQGRGDFFFGLAERGRSWLLARHRLISTCGPVSPCASGVAVFSHLH